MEHPVSEARSLIERVNLDHAALAAFCRRHGFVRMHFFGSVLRDDFGADSDVDVIVDLAPETRLDWDFYSDIPDELAALLGRKVDLGTVADLHPRIRQRVLEESRVVVDLTSDRPAVLPNMAEARP